MIRYYQSSSDDDENADKLPTLNPLINTLNSTAKENIIIMRVPLIMSLTDEGFSYIKEKCRFPIQLNKIAVSCWLEKYDYFYLSVDMKTFTYSSYHYAINDFENIIDINVPIQILKTEVIESIFNKLNEISNSDQFSKNNFIKIGENVNALKDPSSFQNRLQLKMPLFDINIENTNSLIK